MEKKLIAIAGASSGIGAATAKLFAQQGYPLLLMARRTTDEAVKAHYQEWKDGMCGGVLAADDVARTTLFAYEQPQNVCIREIVLATTRQAS